MDSAPSRVTKRPAPAVTVGPSPIEGTVLYVEDDPASVQLIATALSLRPNVGLMTVASASEGLAAISERDFDAVLLDVGLPDGSGWDLLRVLRQQPRTASVPVMVLTAGPHVEPSDAPRPERIMTKPLDLDACLDSIDSLLTRAH